MYINNNCIISEINLSVIDQVESGKWKVKTIYDITIEKSWFYIVCSYLSLTS